MICSISSTLGSSRLIATISRKKLLWRKLLEWTVVNIFSATHRPSMASTSMMNAF